jgi:DNA-binding transcriptional ArsR family regulator
MEHGNREAILMARIKYQEAIGLMPKPGRPPAGPAPTKDKLVKLYVKEGRSVRDVAAVLETTKDSVYRALRKYGIKVRSNVSRSRLRTIPLKDLEAAIRDKGLRGAARDLGVDHSTLSHHLKVRSGNKDNGGKVSPKKALCKL